MATTIATDCAGEPAMARVGALVTGKLLDSQVVCLWVPLILIPIPSSHPHHHQFHVHFPPLTTAKRRRGRGLGEEGRHWGFFAPHSGFP